MNGKRTLLAVLVLGLGGVLIAYAAEEKAKEHKSAELSPAAKEALLKAFPGAEIGKVKMEKEGVQLFEAVVVVKGQETEVNVAADGTVVESSQAVKITDLPKAVADAIAKEAGGAATKELERVQKMAEIKIVPLAKPVTVYEVAFEKDGSEVELALDADGTVVDHKVCKCDENEKKVTLDQVPAAVRAKIQKEAGANAIKEIEQETRDGQAVYEAEWMAGAVKTEIIVSADGKTLGKKTEEGEDKDDDHATTKPERHHGD